MAHPLVKQLYFARSEFKRALERLTDGDARRRLEPMNSISWIVGHLAWQEQLYWLTRMQGMTLLPVLDERFGTGKPASTAHLEEVVTFWTEITQACDSFLERLTTSDMKAPFIMEGEPSKRSVGTMLTRVIYHYWYHIGETLAIRQMLGHSSLPAYVGDLHGLAPYEPH